jgi:hypothetical protein
MHNWSSFIFEGEDEEGRMWIIVVAVEETTELSRIS